MLAQQRALFTASLLTAAHVFSFFQSFPDTRFGLLQPKTTQITFSPVKPDYFTQKSLILNTAIKILFTQALASCYIVKCIKFAEIVSLFSFVRNVAAYFGIYFFLSHLTSVTVQRWLPYRKTTELKPVVWISLENIGFPSIPPPPPPPFTPPLPLCPPCCSSEACFNR